MLWPALIAEFNPTAVTKPSECPLHDMAHASQSTAVLLPWRRQHRRHIPQGAAHAVGQTAVRSIAEELPRPLLRPPTAAVQGRQCIQQRHDHLAIRHVGRTDADDQWHAAAIGNDVPLAAFLGPVGRVRPGVRPPKRARTLALSMTAVCRCRRPLRPKAFTSLACTAGQTPARVQSRRRRQHVTPLPQPSSLGTSRQGIPLLRTKTMPVKQSRSDTRGRPPSGLGGSGGNRGSISFHRVSGTNGWAMIASLHWEKRQVLYQIVAF